MSFKAPQNAINLVLILIFSSMAINAVAATKARTACPACQNQNLNKLTVTGKGKVSVKATQARVTLSIDIKSKSANTTREQLANKSKAVLAALKKDGAKKLQTEAMRIFPEYTRDKKRTLTGYRGKLRISFENHHSKVGALIDKAIISGANRVDYIQVKPTDKILKKAKLKSYENASQNALLRANVVLKTLNLTQTGITRIGLGRDYYRPYYQRRYPMAASMAVRDSRKTTVTKQSQDVTSSVSLTISYE